jgi:hypothetical protein
MSIFGNALSLLNDAQRAFDNFDFDATIDSIMETGKNAFDGFNDFMKTIKDSVSDFKIIIPFNEKKEKFDINIDEDGVITVKVTGKGTRRETKATIPSNCIIDKLNHFVDKKKGNLVVVIPKNVAEDENLKKIKETVTTKVNNTASWLKDALKERAEAVAASTHAPTSKRNSKKNVGKVKPKIVRGKDGKFVSTKKA